MASCVCGTSRPPDVSAASRVTSGRSGASSAQRTESGSPLAETTRQFVSGTRPEAKRQPAWKVTPGPSGAFASKTDLTSYRGVTMVPFASGTSPVF